MKSAEDWYDNNDATTRDGVIAILKQIQLDAMREGMKRAADIANMKGCGIITRHAVNGPFDAYMFRGDIRQEILSAAEQLTEKDL